MANRSQRQIKNVRQGDTVLSYDKGKYRVNRVLDTIQCCTHELDMVRVSFDKTMDIIATGSHPFWVKQKRWCTANPLLDCNICVKQLKVGDRVAHVDGGSAHITSITNHVTEVSKPCYSLLLDGCGVFFVACMMSHTGLTKTS